LRVILVLVVPAIPPPSPQSRASTAPIARQSPPLLTTTMHATRRALCVARTRGTCRSRLGAAGSLPAGGGGGGGCLAAAGGGWRQGGRAAEEEAAG
jgi:hypothetical protein